MATEIRHTAIAARRFINFCLLVTESKTANKLAFKLEMEPAMISRIIKCKANVGPSILLKLHEKYGCDVAVLRRILAGEEFDYRHVAENMKGKTNGQSWTGIDSTREASLRSETGQ